MPYIEDAIQSIIGQTFTAFRLLVIDDGSVDETPELVAEFAKKDARITLVKARGSGLVDARNQGLAWSTSLFIAPMDSDDISMPDRFAKQVSYLQDRPDVHVVGSYVRLIDQHGGSVTDSVSYPTSSGAVRRHLLSNRNPLAHPAVMMRSETIKKLGGYRHSTTTAEDFDLWLRVVEVGNMANLPDILLKYRVHAKQVSDAQRLTQSLAAELAFISSEHRRSGKTDPIEALSEAVTLREAADLHGAPAIVDLCDRFDLVRDVMESGACQDELLHSALAHMASSRRSMRINQRLYADVSARIAAQAFQKGALRLGLRALIVGMSKDSGRFLKASLHELAKGR